MVLLTKFKTWNSSYSAGNIPMALRGFGLLSRALQATVVHLNFFRIHVLCFVFIPLIAGSILYASNGQDGPPYLDALFMAYSAMTVTGLNTVLLRRLTVWQEVILMFLFIIGSSPFVSIITMIVRRHFFRKRIAHLVVTSAEARRRVNAIAKDPENIIDERDHRIKKDRVDMKDDYSRTMTANTDTTRVATLPPPRPTTNANAFPPRTRTIDFDDRTLHQRPSGILRRDNLPAMTELGRRPSRRSDFPQDSNMNTGFGGFPNPIAIAATAVVGKIAATSSSTSAPGPKAPLAPYLTFTPTIGRNSKFRGLTVEQQEELGGVEFRALSLLLKMVVGYWLVLPLLSIVLLAPWMATTTKYKEIFAAPETAVSPTWFVIFHVYSAFGNCGLSLHDSSMVPFQTAYWLLIVTGFLILAGNTAYPVLLRFLIWVSTKVVPRDSQTRQTLQFLLDHPRRCFLYLFPSHQTWYLVVALIILNSVDWVSFMVLDIGNESIESIPAGTRTFVGLFQAVAVRTCGFAAVNLATVAPALQVLYVTMFQLAAYPVALSVRMSNVYAEKSMGIFEDEEDELEVEAKFQDSAQAKEARTTVSYIGYHARKQLAFDMWWLVGALWLLCIIERAKILDGDAPWITIFSLLFEVSSAYGNIGLSEGNGINNTSLSGQLRAGSKVVIIIVMLRGRHRGLPRAIDRSIMLPDDLVEYSDDTSEVLEPTRSISRHATMESTMRGSNDMERSAEVTSQ